MSHPFDEYRETPLWRLLATALSELEANHEVAISTAPEYVIGYLCRRLDAARLAAPTALTYDP
jgi:hypothetical protein